MWVDDISIEDEAAWALTHVPSGHAICAIRGTFEQATSVADRLETIGDWDFSDAGDKAAKASLLEGVREIRAQIGRQWVSIGDTMPPWHEVEFEPASGMSAGTAETAKQAQGQRPASPVGASRDAHPGAGQ